MPDSYPGIEFDKKGVCNNCRDYVSKELLGEDALRQKLRSPVSGEYDCILGISGGRDSCYVAYLAAKKLNLRALAVCYDFPFLCDLARQNIQNVCNALDMELNIVKTKKNLEYNLLRDHIISVAETGTSWGQCLFCHYGIDAVLYKIAQEKRIGFILSGVIEHELWNPGNRTKYLLIRIRRLRIDKIIKFIYHQSKAYCNLVRQRLEFPLPQNHCLSAYKKPKKPEGGPESIKVFDYLPWDQNIIEQTLVEQLGWIRPENQLSWRYDCILEPMLDYTYKKEFGISTAGIYLSGLIRAGLIEREQAQEMLEEIEDEGNLQGKLNLIFDYLEIPASVRQVFYHAE